MLHFVFLHLLFLFSFLSLYLTPGGVSVAYSTCVSSIQSIM